MDKMDIAEQAGVQRAEKAKAVKTAPQNVAPTE